MCLGVFFAVSFAQHVPTQKDVVRAARSAVTAAHLRAVHGLPHF